ncbi:AAI domain-containing protein [Psidium guajava]|nr:AAI domain-containing protein [Psidium guajava]
MTNFECIASSIMVLLMLNSASAAVNTTLVYSICNGDEFTVSDYFALSRDWLLKDLKAETAKNGFNYYSTSDSSIQKHAMAMVPTLESSRMMSAQTA